MLKEEQYLVGKWCHSFNVTLTYIQYGKQEAVPEMTVVFARHVQQEKSSERRKSMQFKPQKPASECYKGKSHSHSFIHSIIKQLRKKK